MDSNAPSNGRTLVNDVANDGQTKFICPSKHHRQSVRSGEHATTAYTTDSPKKRFSKLNVSVV